MTMGTNYRMLGPDEKVEKGDEYRYENTWRKSGNWAHGIQMFHTEYRRPVHCPPAFVPQWKHPDAPSVPVHVLWAESPSTVRTVAQVAAEAKPKPVEPGTGYRLLRSDETVQKEDQFLGHKEDWIKCQGTVGMVVGNCGWTIRRKLPAPLCPIDPPEGYYILGPDVVWREGDLIGDGMDTRWEPLMSYNFGTTSNTWDRCKEPRWCCRKLPVPEPQYRPYTNAAEAAAGLQGKLIHKKDWDWVPVTRVCGDSVMVGNLNPTFKQLLEYKFTDGTPCGVLVTSEKGTK